MSGGRPRRRLRLAPDGRRLPETGGRRVGRRRGDAHADPPSARSTNARSGGTQGQGAPLAAAEVGRLFRLAARGDRHARERLVTANLNLVHHVVRRYRAMGHDGEDLFQVGCVGLIKAVDRFNPSLGYRFSTYAVPLILGEIQRYLRDAAPAGIGRGALRLAQAARHAEERLAGGLLRQPTAAEVAAAVGVSPGELAAALEAARRPASLDEGDARDTGERPLLGRIVGEDGEDGDRLALRQLIAALPARQRQVLLMRFYLDRSQIEVGRALGLSQPQISRLERQALQTLRRQWRTGGGSGPAPRIARRGLPHTPA